jgi:hypothetical protein
MYSYKKVSRVEAVLSLGALKPDRELLVVGNGIRNDTTPFL